MSIHIPIHTFKEMGINEIMAQILHWTEPPKYNIDEIHAHDFYQLLVYKKGGGTHTIDYNQEKINTYSIHLVAKGSVHLSNRNKHSDGFTIAFSNLYLSQLQQFDSSITYNAFYNQSAVFNFNKKEFSELNILFEELFKNENNSSYFLNILAAILAKIILLKKKTVAIFVSDDIVLKFMQFLNEQYLEKNMVLNFLKNENISKITFAKRVKKITNSTVGQLVKEKIHLEAKKLLYATNLSIKEIAYKLNFEDESYFCKIFKQQEGISPKAFRAKCLT